MLGTVPSVAAPVFVDQPLGCSCRWCAKLAPGMPAVGNDFPERAHALNAVVRLRRAAGLPVLAEHESEFTLLYECVTWQLAPFYAAMVQECSR